MVFVRNAERAFSIAPAMGDESIVGEAIKRYKVSGIFYPKFEEAILPLDYTNAVVLKIRRWAGNLSLQVVRYCSNHWGNYSARSQA